MRLLIVTAHKQTPLFCRRLQPPHFSFCGMPKICFGCQRIWHADAENRAGEMKTAGSNQNVKVSFNRRSFPEDFAPTTLRVFFFFFFCRFFDLMCPSNDVLQVYGLMRSDLTGNLFRYKCPVTPWAWRVTGWTTSNATPHCLSASVSVCLFRVSCGWSVDYGRLLLL